MYRVYWNEAAAAYLSLHFFIIFSPIFIHLNFSSHELWGLEGWNYVHMWTLGRCIVYTGNRAAAAYSSLYFFLSNFQTLKFFVTLFSGSVRPRRWKLGTHVDNGWIYGVYQNQAAALICPFIFSFSNIQILKFSSHFSQELWGLEGWNLMHTWTTGGCMCLPESGGCCIFVPLFFHFSLSNFQTLKCFCHTFLRNCEA